MRLYGQHDNNLLYGIDYTGILATDDSIPQGTIRFPSITAAVLQEPATGGDAAHPEYPILPIAVLVCMERVAGMEI